MGLTVTKLSSSTTPETRLGYDPQRDTFRILQKDWLTQVTANLGISKPSAFDMLHNKAQRRGIVFVDPSAGPRKTVLSWDLVRLVDSIDDAMGEQDPQKGELLRGYLGYWPDLDELHQLMISKGIVESEEHCEDVPTESFLERYRRCKQELEKSDSHKHQRRSLRYNAIAAALAEVLPDIGFKEIVSGVWVLQTMEPWDSLNALEDTKNKHATFLGTLEHRDQIYTDAGETPPPATDSTGLLMPAHVLKHEEEEKAELERVLADPGFAKEFLEKQEAIRRDMEETLPGWEDGLLLLSLDRVKERLDELTRCLDTHYTFTRNHQSFNSGTTSRSLNQ